MSTKERMRKGNGWATPERAGKYDMETTRKAKRKKKYNFNATPKGLYK